MRAVRLAVDFGLQIPSWVVGKDVLQEEESHYFNHDISQTSFSMNLVNHAHGVIVMIWSLMCRLLSFGKLMLTQPHIDPRDSGPM